MYNKILILGKQVKQIESHLPNFCKKIMQENTGRFLIHKEDLLRIYNEITETAVQCGMVPEIITATDFDSFSFDETKVKLEFLTGYHSNVIE